MKYFKEFIVRGVLIMAVVVCVVIAVFALVQILVFAPTETSNTGADSTEISP